MIFWFWHHKVLWLLPLELLCSGWWVGSFIGFHYICLCMRELSRLAGGLSFAHRLCLRWIREMILPNAYVLLFLSNLWALMHLDWRTPFACVGNGSKCVCWMLCLFQSPRLMLVFTFFTFCDHSHWTLVIDRLQLHPFLRFKATLECL